MALLKTNTKFYIGKIQNYIIDNIQAPHIGSYYGKVKHLLHCFNVEHNYPRNKQRTPNLQNRIAEWLNGAPFVINLPVYYTDIIADTAKLHNVEQLSGTEQVKVCNNYHNHMAYHILKLAKNLKIELTDLY